MLEHYGDVSINADVAPNRFDCSVVSEGARGHRLTCARMPLFCGFPPGCLMSLMAPTGSCGQQRRCCRFQSCSTASMRKHSKTPQHHLAITGAWAATPCPPSASSTHQYYHHPWSFSREFVAVEQQRLAEVSPDVVDDLPVPSWASWLQWRESNLWMLGHSKVSRYDSTLHRPDLSAGENNEREHSRLHTTPTTGRSACCTLMLMRTCCAR